MDERSQQERGRTLWERYVIGYVDGTGKAPSHPDIQMLERELKKLEKEGRLKGINLYVYGLVLREQERLK